MGLWFLVIKAKHKFRLRLCLTLNQSGALSKKQHPSWGSLLERQPHRMWTQSGQELPRLPRSSHLHQSSRKGNTDRKHMLDSDTGPNAVPLRSINSSEAPPIT